MMIDEYTMWTVLLALLFAVAGIAVGAIVVQGFAMLFYGYCKLIVDFKQRRFERREDDREIR